MGEHVNPSQLENIELRLAAVRGRPWVVTGRMVGPSRPLASLGSTAALDLGRRVNAQVQFCPECADKTQRDEEALLKWERRLVTASGFGAFREPPPGPSLCEDCSSRHRAALLGEIAAFRAEAADGDELKWLAKAPEDIEALIRAVQSLSEERDALAKALERETGSAREARTARDHAQEELRKLKASLATLKELL